MKFLFYIGKLKLFSEDSLKQLHYQEILNICIQTISYQKLILLEESKNKKEKMYYGKPVIKQIERAIEFVEQAFPDIRKTVKKMSSDRKSN